MHLEKTSILLEKINNLYKGIVKDSSNVSRIELDLLKDYVKSFYEAIHETNQNGQTKIKKKKKEKIKEEVIEPSKGNKADQESQAPEAPSVPPVQKESDHKPPRIIQLSKEMEEEIASTPPPQSVEVRHTPPPMDNEAMSELFIEEQKQKDISSKLSNQPISNLNKAMSINERIFTMNELFGGNMDELDATIKRLNNCSSFDEARSAVLEQKAAQYHWAAKERLNKAKKFIHLVRRRYL